MAMDASWWGQWGVPLTLLEYGDSGDGKTGDLGYAFHGMAAWLGEPRHIKSVAALTGIAMSDLCLLQARMVHEVTDQLPTLANLGYLAVVVDDLSVLATTSFAYHDDRAPKGQSGAKDGFYAHTETSKDITRMRTQAAELGLHVAWNAHPDPPDVDAKKRPRKGGPSMPNGKLRAAVPVIADVTIRTRRDITRTVGWKGVFDCDERDPNWHMRDRHNIVPRTGPLNAGELIRMIGYPLPRPAHIEVWEPLVEEAAELLAQGAAWPGLRDQLFVAIDADTATWSTDAREIAQAWIARDAYDRYLLRKASAGKRLSHF